MANPTQFPTWATTADGQAVFVPDQFSFNQAVKPVAAGGLGASWSTATAPVTRALGSGGGTVTVTQPRVSDEQNDGRPTPAAQHGHVGS